MALFNLARMTTATVGTGTITLGSAVPGFLTFAQAGVVNGTVVSYGIIDGVNSECGTGTYTSAGTTLTRTVVNSTNSNAAISLSGNAHVSVTALAQDIGNVANSGTPTAAQYAKWVTATSIQGVAAATVLSDIGAASASAVITQVVVQKFVASGTYTPTAGMKFCIIEVVAGGGAGGGAVGAASQYYIGGGGGSGSYARKLATAADIGASKTVTVGLGGTAVSGGNGNAGGSSAVGVLCTATGGSGGTFSSSGQNGTGGAGGSAGSGDIAANGSPGHPGFYNSVNTTIGTRGGVGASSIFGGGGYAVAAGAGTNAGPYGAGGGGGAQAAAGTVAGGAGSNGIVFITEFI